MSLKFYISSDSTFTLAKGQELGNAVVRLGDLLGLTERAESGQPAFSSIQFDDPGGALNIPGLRPFWVDETSANPIRVFTGYLADRHYSRSGDRSSLVTTARQVEATVVDLNGVFKLRVFGRLQAGLRPRETHGARISWLIATGMLPAIANAGNVNTTITKMMGATDYRSMYPQDVLDDLAGAVGGNYWAYWDNAGQQIALYFHSATAAGYASTMRLSNFASDVDNVTTFAAKFEEEKDPSNVYSGIDYIWPGGRTYQYSNETAAAFTIRDTTWTAGAKMSRAEAVARARAILTTHNGEADRVMATARIPAAYLNLALNGHRIMIRATNLDNYTSFTSIRITSRSVSQQAPDGTYMVTYELYIPRIGNGGPPPQPIFQQPFQKECGGILQSANNSDVPVGANYNVVLPNAPTSGNTLVAFLFIKAPGVGPTLDTVSIGTGVWTKGPTANGFDAAQFGGPGNAVRISSYYRTVGAADPATYTIVPLGQSSGAVIYELTGLSGSPTTFTGSDTVYAGVANTVGPITATGFMIGGFALQRTNYAPHDNVTVGGGGETIWNDDLQGLGTGGEAPWVFLATKASVASPMSFTGTVTANPNLDRWGRATVALVWTDTGDCTQPEPGQPIAPEAVGTGTGAVGTPTTPSSQTFVTNYPYQPGSLLVTVDGIRVIPVETDPTTGTFTLSPAPSAGAAVVVSYQAATPDATTATNPAASPSSGTVGAALVDASGNYVGTRKRNGVLKLLVADDVTDALLVEVLMELQAINELLAAR